MEEKEIDNFIGKRLREKRLRMGLTLTDLAEKLGVSHQQIQKYEQAQSRLSAANLYELAQIMGIESNYFFQGFHEYQKKKEKIDSDLIVPQKDLPLHVLLVEDDPADELLARRAFEDCSFKVEIFTVHDGSAALDFLRNKSTLVNFPRPDIVLLDLNIPKRDGATVLKEMKRDRELCDIPVVILTNSLNFQEMLSCYRSQAAGYICKSFDFDIFQKSLEAFVAYWAQAVVLPHRAHN